MATDTISPLVLVPVVQIDPHPDNPRRDLGDLADLTKSIKAQGIRQNLLLVRTGEEEEIDEVGLGVRHRSRYTVVIGHRRLEAAKAAGLVMVPCSIAELTPAQQLELMLLENIQREDLSPIEEAEGFQGLLDLGVGAAAITKATGISGKTVRSRLQLLTLPEAAQTKVHEGQASLLDAAKLEAFADEPKALEALTMALGTNDFAHRLQEERESLNRRQKQAPIIARLVERGAVQHQRGKGWDGIDRRYSGTVETVEQADTVELPEGTTFEASSWRADVTLFVPYGTAVDMSEEAAAERRAEREAEEARWAAEAEAREALQAARATAYEVRDQWVREFAKAAKPTAKEVGAIVAAAAAYSPLYPHHTATLANWLGLEGNDAWQRNKIEKALAKWLPGVAPASVLLVLLHVSVGRDVIPEHAPVFDAFEACGYVVSSVERGWLAPEADDETEAN